VDCEGREIASLAADTLDGALAECQERFPLLSALGAGVVTADVLYPASPAGDYPLSLYGECGIPLCSGERESKARPKTPWHLKTQHTDRPTADLYRLRAESLHLRATEPAGQRVLEQSVRVFTQSV
jgi:hypothetical protein